MDVQVLDAASVATGFKQGDADRVSAMPEFFNEAQAEMFVDVIDAVMVVAGAHYGGMNGDHDSSREIFVERDGVKFKVTVEAVV